MTNSDRDRLEAVLALAESNTRNIDILVGIVTTHQQRHAEQDERMEQVLNEIRDMKAEIREMQIEIRGLQTENRRILDRLFGQPDSE